MCRILHAHVSCNMSASVSTYCCLALVRVGVLYRWLSLMARACVTMDHCNLALFPKRWYLFACALSDKYNLAIALNNTHRGWQTFLHYYCLLFFFAVVIHKIQNERGAGKYDSSMVWCITGSLNSPASMRCFVFKHPNESIHFPPHLTHFSANALFTILFLVPFWIFDQR